MKKRFNESYKQFYIQTNNNLKVITNTPRKVIVLLFIAVFSIFIGTLTASTYLLIYEANFILGMVIQLSGIILSCILTFAKLHRKIISGMPKSNAEQPQYTKKHTWLYPSAALVAIALARLTGVFFENNTILIMCIVLCILLSIGMAALCTYLMVILVCSIKFGK